MAKRDSNIVLNTTDNGEPAVQRRTDAEESIDNEPTDDESTDEPTDGVTNPDGSTIVSATPKEPSGTSTTENIPQNLLEPEIQQFKAETDHPEDWTDLELKAVGLRQRHPDLSTSEISDRLGISKSVVRRGERKVSFAELSDKNEIYAAFRDCTTTQQAVIAASVASSEYTNSEISDMAACTQNTVRSTRRRFRPLMRTLNTVGLPDSLVPKPILDDSNARADTEQTADETDTDDQRATETETKAPEREIADKTGPEPTAARPAIEDVRQFVTVLREAATKEHALSDSPTLNRALPPDKRRVRRFWSISIKRIPSEQ
jgi:hypothetical protein